MCNRVTSVTALSIAAFVLDMLMLNRGQLEWFGHNTSLFIVITEDFNFYSFIHI